MWCHVNADAVPPPQRRRVPVDGEAGAWLAEMWSLPPAIAEAIRYHHSPRSGDTTQPLAGVVHIADQLANALTDESSRIERIRRLAEDPVWELLSASNPEIRNVDIPAFTTELEDHLERARHLTRFANW